MTIKELLEKAYYSNEQVTVWIGEGKSGGDIHDVLKNDSRIHQEVRNWCAGESNIGSTIIEINTF